LLFVITLFIVVTQGVGGGAGHKNDGMPKQFIVMLTIFAHIFSLSGFVVITVIYATNSAQFQRSYEMLGEICRMF
jgi:hypothetical protein